MHTLLELIKLPVLISFKYLIVKILQGPQHRGRYHIDLHIQREELEHIQERGGNIFDQQEMLHLLPESVLGYLFLELGSVMEELELLEDVFEDVSGHHLENIQVVQLEV